MFIRLSAALLLLFSISDVARADEPVPKVETILSGLDAPCAVAVQPQAGTIFVVEAGAGQIFKLDPNVPEKAVPLVTGLPATPARKPAVRFGQFGLNLLDWRTLIVAAWEKDGKQTLRVFELPDEGTPLKWADAKQQLDAAKPSSAATPQFCGVTATPAAVYLSHNDPAADSILKAEIKSDRTLGPAETLVKLSDVDFPGALISKGNMLIVAQLGKLDAKQDATISFFDARSGQRLLDLSTGLRDVVGLAYCPASGRLYAIDFSAAEPAKAGLYRLDATMVDSRQGVTAVKIVNLERPTALAFGPDKTAYVTLLGAAGSDSAKGKAAKRGSLVKITDL